MRQDNFTFVPTCTLIVDANNTPSVRGMDEAFKRRMSVIPFKNTIAKEEVDPDLPEKLRAEAPEILRWIIDGAAKWHHDGLNNCRAIEEATREYLDTEDTFEAFLNERFVLDPAGRVANRDLYANHAAFMNGQGLSAWAQTTLSKEMKKRGFEPYSSGNERGFKGLKLMVPGFVPRSQ